jgi:hypothetical protein
MRAYSIRHLFQGTEADGAIVPAEVAGNGVALNVAGLASLGIQVAMAAYNSFSASPSASASISPSGSASPSASASISPSSSASGSPCGSASPSASVSPSASASAAVGASGTVGFEATIDGTTWYQLPCTPAIGGTAVVNTTAPGLWLVSVAGLAAVRCRLSGTVVGGITVTGLGTTVSR